MSEEDRATIDARKNSYDKAKHSLTAVSYGEQTLKDAAVVKAAISPAPSSSKTVASRFAKKSRKPDTKVTLKIDKVVEGVEAAHEQLHVADMMTKRKLAILRYMEEDRKTDTGELWKKYDRMSSSTWRAYQLNKINECVCPAFMAYCMC